LSFRQRAGPTPLAQPQAPHFVHSNQDREMGLRSAIPLQSLRGFLAATILSFAGLGAEIPSHAYRFPLEGETWLTSTFGEYRHRHFHGGLDLSTGGKPGRIVYAVADGYVWRIRVSGDGYGKAIYLRLEDGRTAVYGHLAEFAPRIREVAERLQEARGRYRIDEILEDRALRFSEGEPIGVSGGTGAGPPHLHFELREGELQINPLAAGITLPDTSPPRIRSIVLTPLGPRSRVNGRNEPLAVGVRFDRKRSLYAAPRAVLIQGDIAVSCSMRDRAGAGSGKLVPYEASLVLDGRPVYQVRFDAVPLTLTQQVELVYSVDETHGGQYAINLFRAPGRAVVLGDEGPSLAGVISAVEGSRGTVFAGKGKHVLRVEARDFFGNERAAELTVIADRAPRLERVGYDGNEDVVVFSGADPDGDPVEVRVEVSTDGGETWRQAASVSAVAVFADTLALGLEGTSWTLRLSAEDEFGAVSQTEYIGPGLQRAEAAPPHLRLALRDGFLAVECECGRGAVPRPQIWLTGCDGGELLRSLQVEREAPGSFRAVVELSPEIEGAASVVAAAPGALEPAVEPLGIVRADPRGGGRLRLPGGAVMELGEDTFLDVTYFRVVARDSLPVAPPDELVSAGAALRCDPADQYFERAARLFLPVGEQWRDDARVGLYRLTGARKWRWVAGERSGGMVGGDISRFSEFAVMADLEPPAIRGLRPREGSRSRRSRPVLRAKVKDGGSGVDWDSVYFTIDGEKLITAWEADAAAAWARPRRALPPGRHSVEIHASDRAGNEASERSWFYISE